MDICCIITNNTKNEEWLYFLTIIALQNISELEIILKFACFQVCSLNFAHGHAQPIVLCPEYTWEIFEDNLGKTKNEKNDIVGYNLLTKCIKMT